MSISSLHGTLPLEVLLLDSLHSARVLTAVAVRRPADEALQMLRILLVDHGVVVLRLQEADDV